MQCRRHRLRADNHALRAKMSPQNEFIKCVADYVEIMWSHRASEIEKKMTNDDLGAFIFPHSF